MKYLFVFFIFCFYAYGESFTVVNWNVQTFFDDVQDGYEYKDFQEHTWDKDKYISRLKRLGYFMMKCNAEVYIFEEIEKKEILKDLTDTIKEIDPNLKNRWKHSFFYKNEGSAIGLSILSDHPIKDIKIHNIQSKIYTRPIIKATLHKGNESLNLYINHWKSQKGGSESDYIRNLQELSLSALLEGEERALITGDFNKGIRDFKKKNGHYFMKASTQALYNPWEAYLKTSITKGSVCYKDVWDTFDNFFILGDLEVEDFTVPQGSWLSKEGKPIRYKLYNNQGYSDHAPIMCKINIH